MLQPEAWPGSEECVLFREGNNTDSQTWDIIAAIELTILFDTLLKRLQKEETADHLKCNQLVTKSSQEVFHTNQT